MISIIVIGTLNIIPVTPHNKPQKAKEIKTTKGLTFKELPINLGSITLPTKNWIKPIDPNTIKGFIKVPNCNKAINAGKIVAIKEPMVGIKLRTKIKKEWGLCFKSRL
mgnify:CR=1 FL=1